jgi:hypothetical protein
MQRRQIVTNQTPETPGTQAGRKYAEPTTKAGEELFSAFCFGEDHGMYSANLVDQVQRLILAIEAEATTALRQENERLEQRHVIDESNEAVFGHALAEQDRTIADLTARAVAAETQMATLRKAAQRFRTMAAEFDADPDLLSEYEAAAHGLEAALDAPADVTPEQEA